MAQLLSDMGSGARAWQHFESQVERARARFAGFIGAEVDQIAIVPNASVGAYQAASSLGLGRRNKIVVGGDEFPSIAHVWLAQRPNNVEVTFVDRKQTDLPPVDEFVEAIDDRTALVSVPLVAYASGIRWPTNEIVQAAHARGSQVFVDAYQAVGVLPVNVQELECDYLVSGCHKYLMGLPGLAFLYVREWRRSSPRPQLTGWFGREDPFSFDSRHLDFPHDARRFQTGTPAIPAAYAASAVLELLGPLDLKQVEVHVESLLSRLESQLAGTTHELLMPGGVKAQGAHVGISSADPIGLAAWLDARGVWTSPRGDLLRISFHYYNDTRDVDRLGNALAERAEATPN